MWLQGPNTLITSSGGAISTAVAPSLSVVTNAANFRAVYDEWRLTKIRFMVMPAGSAVGSTKFVVDDEDTTAPGYAWASSRVGTTLSNNNAGYIKSVVLNYRAEDLNDLGWHSSNTQASVADCALKVYTDATNYGSSLATAIWIVQWEGYFEFRGIGANA